ncbi:hypothetical protein JCM11251_004127 [Rhodosporidiobolus azoricus]
MSPPSNDVGPSTSDPPYRVPDDVRHSLLAAPAQDPIRLRLHLQAYHLLWGKDNLRSTQGVPHFAPLPAAFMVIFGNVELPAVEEDEEAIYVREEHLELSQKTEEQERLTYKQYWCGMFYLGSPGTSKSTFLLFQTLLCAEQRRPFMIASSQHPERGYLWTTDGVFEVPTDIAWHTRFEFRSSPTRVRILFDSIVDVVAPVPSYFLSMGNVTSIIAISPQTKGFLHLQGANASLNTTPSSLSTLLAKYKIDPSSCQLVLPYAAREVSASTALPKHRPHPNAYGVLELFDILGGSVRHFLSSQVIAEGRSKKDPLGDVFLRGRTRNLGYPPQIILQVLQGRDIDSEAFHSVVHIRPVTGVDRVLLGSPDYELFFATKYLRAMSAASFRRLSLEQRTQLATAALSLSTLRGYYFEVAALNHFAIAVSTFTLFCRECSILQTHNVEPVPLCEWDPRAMGAQPPSEPSLSIFPPSFPGFDAVLFTSVSDPIFLLQITTSTSPDLKVAAFHHIFSACSDWAEKPVFVVFVTPTQEIAQELLRKRDGYSTLPGSVEGVSVTIRNTVQQQMESYSCRIGVCVLGKSAIQKAMVVEQIRLCPLIPQEDFAKAV